MAVCLCAPAFASTRHKTTSGKKSKASSSRHTSSKSARRGKTRSHSKSARAHLPPAPTPERYQQFQQALADKGYYKGAVNGEWGPDSVAALNRFKADQKLPSDGKLDSPAIIALGLGPRHASAANVTPAANPTPSTPAGSTPNDYRSPEGSQRP